MTSPNTRTLATVEPACAVVDSLSTPTIGAPHVITHRILAQVKAERQRQTQLLKDGMIQCNLGDPEEPQGAKLAVLMEEVGEVARALNDNEPAEDLKAELIQVAAVATAWAEAF